MVPRIYVPVNCKNSRDLRSGAFACVSLQNHPRHSNSIWLRRTFTPSRILPHSVLRGNIEILEMQCTTQNGLRRECEGNAKGMQMQMRDAVPCTTETVSMQFRLWYLYVPEGQGQPTFFFPPGSDGWSFETRQFSFA